MVIQVYKFKQIQIAYNSQLVKMSSARGSPIRRLQLFQRDAATPITNRSVPQSTLLQQLQLQNDKIVGELHLKNLQIQELYQENKTLKIRCQDQLATYEKTILLMQKQLKESQKSRQSQFALIRQKYDKYSVEETQSMKNYHEHQIQFLLKEIAHLRADSTIKQEKILLKSNQFQSMKQSFQRQIQDKIKEVNNLNSKCLVSEQNKNKQIKQLSSKRELERSRTSGLVSSRKQNNQFMDKQLRKLNEQVLDKTIKIQSLMRDNSKLKKKFDQNQKAYCNKIQELITERQQENRQRQAHFMKIQKNLREEILENKTKEVNLQGQIDSMQGQIQSLNAEIGRNKQLTSDKNNQIKQYKNLLQKQRDQHANQISRLLKQRKKRSSNLGSSRSLSSSMKDSAQIGQSASGMITALKKNDSVRLPTVKQQSPDKSPSKSLQGSRLSEQNQLGEQDHQLSRAVYHYDALIQQLKRSHSSEVQLLKHKNQKLSKNYEQKQQQVLDILTRFSPLVKIHTQQKTVQQDRKQRIERHWKADLGLLDILINKYKIKVYD